MGSISKVTADRAKRVERLVLSDDTTSQWLDAACFRSCFCAATVATPAEWIIEGLLPDGQTVELGNYELNNLFDPDKPRYITVNAMCGLSIRFKSSVPQVGSQLWVILKS